MYFFFPSVCWYADRAMQADTEYDTLRLLFGYAMLVEGPGASDMHKCREAAAGT